MGDALSWMDAPPPNPIQPVMIFAEPATSLVRHHFVLVNSEPVKKKT